MKVGKLTTWFPRSIQWLLSAACNASAAAADVATVMPLRIISQKEQLTSIATYIPWISYSQTMVMWSRRYRQPLCHCTKYANLQSFFPEQCHFLMSWRHTSPPPPLSPPLPPFLPPPQLNRNYDGGGKQMTDWHFSNYDTTDLKKWWWPCWLISCMTLDKYLQRRLVLSTTKQQQGRRKVWKSKGDGNY